MVQSPHRSRERAPAQEALTGYPFQEERPADGAVRYRAADPCNVHSISRLAIFWTATAWVAGGLFLAPIVGGGEPRGQEAGIMALLLALTVVVFGSLGGEWLGLSDRLGTLWFWLGHQGSEYLDLGRFWQFLLAVGLAGWLVLMYRALRTSPLKDHQ